MLFRGQDVGVKSKEYTNGVLRILRFVCVPAGKSHGGD